MYKFPRLTVLWQRAWIPLLKVKTDKTIIIRAAVILPEQKRYDKVTNSLRRGDSRT